MSSPESQPVMGSAVGPFLVLLGLFSATAFVAALTLYTTKGATASAQTLHDLNYVMVVSAFVFLLSLIGTLVRFHRRRMARRNKELAS